MNRKTQHERISTASRVVSVEESGLRFLVNLSDYVDTGLFLDHRPTRDLVRQSATGKRFLNLFAYTGAFTVYAAAGGALSTTSVDLSATYLEWAERNMSANDFRGRSHRFVRSDAREFIHHHPRGKFYDLAVIDVPTFSNSKGMEGFWEVERDHVLLINETLELMPEGGTLLFATNYRRFKLDREGIRSADVVDISHQTIPADFRNRRAHCCFRIRRTAR